MTAWHEEEGGIYNDYQIDELVALIRYVDWPEVGELAAQHGLIPPTLPVPDVDDDFLAQVAALDRAGRGLGAGLRHLRRQLHRLPRRQRRRQQPGCAPEHGRSPRHRRRRTDPHHHRRRARHDDGQLGQCSQRRRDRRRCRLHPKLGRHHRRRAGTDAARTGPDRPRTIPTRCWRWANACSPPPAPPATAKTAAATPAPPSTARISSPANTDEQIASTIINGGHRPNSIMPAFGDRLTSVEIDALVSSSARGSRPRPGSRIPAAQPKAAARPGSTPRPIPTTRFRPAAVRRRPARRSRA